MASLSTTSLSARQAARSTAHHRCTVWKSSSPAAFSARAIHSAPHSSYTSSSHTSSYPSRRNILLFASSLTAAALVVNSTSPLRADAAPVEQQRAEKARSAISKGVDRVKQTASHLLHSGHEHLGVHLWGTNRNKIVAPDGPSVATLSGPPIVKKPRYLPGLAGQTFRDLALHDQYAVAVTSSGDLVQWGTAYSPACRAPERTLRGMDVVQVALTPAKIYARTRGGQVLVVPVSKDAQHDTSYQPMPSISWYWRILGYHNPEAQYRTMQLLDADGKPVNKKITDIACGRSHILALSTDGRAMAACVDSNANECGQLGSPRLLEAASSKASDGTSEIIRESDLRYDETLKEIPSLRKLNISQIAAGDRHSLALTTEGRVLAWGNNSNGQLALGASYSFPTIPTPTESALTAAYPRTARIKPLKVIAGGDTSFFVVEREDMKSANDPAPQGLGMSDGSSKRTYSDLLAAGQGANGQLGNGQWGSSGQAVRVKTVSGLTEFSEATQSLRNIPIDKVSISATHAAITLGNALYDTATKQYFGNDVFVVGHNADYQLGTGKRSNLAVPQHIGPLPYARLSAEAAVQGKDDDKEAKSAEEGMDSGARTHMPHKRLQLAPRTWNHKKAEERIVCGYGTTAVYWHVDP